MPSYSASDVEIFATGIPESEGLVVANDGNLYVSSVDGWVYRVSPQGEVVPLARLPGRPLGLALDCEGVMFVCDWEAPGVYRVDPTGQVTLFANAAGSRPIQYPNFAVFDEHGWLYVSDSGTSRPAKGIRNPDGAIFRIAPTGECEVWAEGLYLANGLALRWGEAAVYVAQTIENNVLRLEISADGRVGERRVFAENLLTVPDGMAFTASGDLLVVTGLREVVYTITSDGQAGIFVEDANGDRLRSPANCAFGGPHLDQLYFTNLDSDYVSRLPSAPRGQPLYHQL